MRFSHRMVDGLSQRSDRPILDHFYIVYFLPGNGCRFLEAESLHETQNHHVPLILCHNIVFYLYKIVWPVRLSSHYPFPDPLAISHPMVVAGVGGTLALIAARRVNVRDMITHTFGLADTARGFALTAGAKDSIKVIIEPQR